MESHCAAEAPLNLTCSKPAGRQATHHNLQQRNQHCLLQRSHYRRTCAGAAGPPLTAGSSKQLQEEQKRTLS